MNGPSTRWPVHPVLLAAFPVLSLWSQNLGELADASPVAVLGVVLAVAAGVLALAAAAYRDWRRGALLASTVVLVGLNLGRVTGPSVGPTVALGVAAVLLVAVAVLVARAGASTVAVGTALLNVAGLVMVVLTGAPIAMDALQGAEAGAAEQPVDVSAAGTAGRDIYYIVLDRYPRADSLQRLFGFDNSAFTGFLEDRGFQVADGSVANYNKTAHSLVSTLNLGYLDELERLPDSEDEDLSHVYDRLRDHRVGRIVTGAGYRYVHVGGWWGPSATADSADTVLTRDRRSEFVQVFELTTAWRALAAMLPGVHAPGETPADDGPVAGGWATERRLRQYTHTRHQLSQLERLAGQPHDTPRFVFAHLTLPHEPYVFAADGSRVTQAEAERRDRATNVTGQVTYANRRLRPILEQLLAGPEASDPVVILQADEGPHPVEFRRHDMTFDWTEASTAQLREKLWILNAYHLPGPDAPAVPEDITPVNTFRIVLGHYLGLDLPRLPDRSYVYDDKRHFYDLTEVTDRVR